MSADDKAKFTVRFAQFQPPCWQVWDEAGATLIAAFATEATLHAALPAIVSHRANLSQKENSQ